VLPADLRSLITTDPAPISAGPVSTQFANAHGFALRITSSYASIAALTFFLNLQIDVSGSCLVVCHFYIRYYSYRFIMF